MTKKSEKVPRITKMWHRDYKVNSYYWENGTNRLAPLRTVTNFQFARKKKKATSAKRDTEIAECSKGRYVCIYDVKSINKRLQVYTLYMTLLLLEWDLGDKLMDTCNVSVNLTKELQTIRTVVKPRTDTIRTGKKGKSKFSHLSFVLVDVCF